MHLPEQQSLTTRSVYRYVNAHVCLVRFNVINVATTAATLPTAAIPGEKHPRDLGVWSSQHNNSRESRRTSICKLVAFSVKKKKSHSPNFLTEVYMYVIALCGVV